MASLIVHIEIIHVVVIEICLHIHFHGLLSLKRWLMISGININIRVSINGGLSTSWFNSTIICCLIAFLDVAIQELSPGVKTYRSASIISVISALHVIKSCGVCQSFVSFSFSSLNINNLLFFEYCLLLE